jgi:hypothetical protein
MNMNRKAMFAAGASMATAFLAACSDSPSAPQSRSAFVPKSSFAVGDATDATPVNTLIKICKVGDAIGTFTITDVGNGSASGNPTIIDDDPGTAGNQKTMTPGPDATPNCVTAVQDLGNATNDIGDFFTVSEATDAGVTTETSCFLSGAGEQACPAQFFINTAHGWTILVRNTAPTPPADVCDFSTFGGFVLLPNNISYGGNAGFASSGFAYGSLNFVNHTTGDHIHVWNVTDYGHPDTGPLSQYPDSRLAFGLASVNGGPENIPVEWRFVDLGEPAKKVGDAVYLTVGGVVLIPEQVVIGGNIQLHAKCKKAPKAEKH